MNKKTKNKLKRAVPSALLAGLCVIGSAGAYLTTVRTADETNCIKVGTVSIMFDNEKDAITLSEAMPMSHEWADTHNTPYTFDIVNDGDVDLNYKIYIAQVDGNLDTVNNVSVSVDNLAEEGEEAYQSITKLATINGEELGVDGATILYDGRVNKGETDNFKFNIHIEEDVVSDTAGIQGESGTYKLFVVAEQVKSSKLTVVDDGLFTHEINEEHLTASTTINTAKGEAQEGTLTVTVPEKYEDNTITDVSLNLTNTSEEIKNVVIKDEFSRPIESIVSENATSIETIDISESQVNSNIFNNLSKEDMPLLNSIKVEEGKKEIVDEYLSGSDLSDIIIEEVPNVPEVVYSKLATGETVNTKLNTFKTATAIEIVNTGIPDGSLENEQDLSIGQDGTVKAWLDGTTIKIGYKGETLTANENSAKMFSNYGPEDSLQNVTSIKGLELLNVENVTDMSNMFYGCGSAANSFNLEGINSWNVSKVTNMSNMFSRTGNSAQSYSLDLNNWDVSGVTDMSNMFYYAGRNSKEFNLEISNWNVSNVENMSGMFFSSAFNANSITLDLEKWDTSKVTSMTSMFYNAFQNASELNGSITIKNNNTTVDKMFEFAATTAKGVFKVNYVSDETKSLAETAVVNATEGGSTAIILGDNLYPTPTPTPTPGGPDGSLSCGVNTIPSNDTCECLPGYEGDPIKGCTPEFSEGENI